MTNLPSDIQVAFVYGSTAYNQEQEKSDIDLFVLGDIDGERLHRYIFKLEEKIGVRLILSIWMLLSLGLKLKRKTPF